MNVIPCESMENPNYNLISFPYVDGRKENNHLIGKSQFDLMKPELFLNLSRGSVMKQ